MGALSLVLAVLTGWLWIGLALRGEGRKRNWAWHLTRAALGVGGGIGLASGIFFLLVVLGLAYPAVVFSIDLVLSGLGVFLWRRAPAPVTEDPTVPAGFRGHWLLALCLAVGWLLVGAAWIESTRSNPYGEWDAWSIWNLRAKFLTGADGAWKHAASPLLEHTHPEYPLLTSAFIARVWRCSGDTADWVPVVAGLLLACSVPALLVGALVLLCGTTTGLLAGMLFLASAQYLAQAVSQCADVPLSFYYLAALVLIALAGAARRPEWLLVLAGAFASLAAWTKNEGIPFATLVLGAYLVLEWRCEGLTSAFRKWRFLVLGAAPGALLVTAFKVFLSPGREPTLQQPLWEAVRKLGQLDRYATIAKALSAEVLELGLGPAHPLLLLGILAVAVGVRRPRDWQRSAVFAALAVALTYAAYCGVYLVTPHNLEWQLSTSAGRLYAQLWPGFLWAAFLLLKPVESRLVTDAPARQARPARPKRRKGH